MPSANNNLGYLLPYSKAADDFLQTLDWPAGAAMSFALTALTMLVIGVSSRLMKRWGGQA